MLKKCKVCLIETEEYRMVKHSSFIRTGKYRNICKPCQNAKDRQAYKDDPSVRFRIDNFKSKNKDKVKQYSSKHYANNKESRKAKSAAYSAANKDDIRKYKAKYDRQRRSIDPLFRLKKKIRSLMYCVTTRKGYLNRSSNNTMIGIDWQGLFEHLKQSAINRYGLFEEECYYEIDHITPLCSAKTELELISLNHYTNLQFLKYEDHLNKSIKDRQAYLIGLAV